jgi:hypothetical protein
MHPQPYPTRPQPALHLLHGLWVASCPLCGFQLATARTQARCERTQPAPGLPGLPGGPLMSPGLRHPGGLDPNQAAALHHLVAAFGAEQVTVTAIQVTELAGQDLTTTTPAQASLLEEAS